MHVEWPCLSIDPSMEIEDFGIDDCSGGKGRGVVGISRVWSFLEFLELLELFVTIWCHECPSMLGLFRSRERSKRSSSILQGIFSLESERASELSWSLQFWTDGSENVNTACSVWPFFARKNGQTGCISGASGFGSKCCLCYSATLSACIWS